MSRIRLLPSAIALAVLCACEVHVGAPSLVWDFDDQPGGTLPNGFRASDCDAKVLGESDGNRLLGVVALEDRPASVLVGCNTDSPDFSVRVRMPQIRSPEDAACSGAIVGSDPSGRCFCVSYCPTAHAVELVDMHDGTRDTIAVAKDVAAADHSTHPWVALRVKCVGERIQCFVDEKLVLSHDLPRAGSGDVGFYCSPSAVAVFDDAELVLQPPRR